MDTTLFLGGGNFVKELFNFISFTIIFSFGFYFTLKLAKAGVIAIKINYILRKIRK